MIIFPNPSVNSMNIEAQLLYSSDYIITIYNVLGEIIYIAEGASKNLKLNHSVDTQNWHRGTYFVKIKTGNSIITRKVVK